MIKSVSGDFSFPFYMNMVKGKSEIVQKSKEIDERKIGGNGVRKVKTAKVFII